MPPTPASFTTDNIGRVIAAVLEYEQTGADTTSPKSSSPPAPNLGNGNFLARITAHTQQSSPSVHWRYSFAEVTRDPAAEDGFATLTPGRTGDSTNTTSGAIYAINGAEPYGGSGTTLPIPVSGSPVVLMATGYFITSDTSPLTIPIYSFFHCPVVANVFRVNLTQNGGSNGTAPSGSTATTATYTYDVYSLAGDKLATALTPESPRWMAGPVTAATAGLAYWSGSALILSVAWEYMGGKVCASS